MTLSESKDLKGLCFQTSPLEYYKIIEIIKSVIFCQRYKKAEFLFDVFTNMSGDVLLPLSLNEFSDVNVLQENEIREKI